MDDISKEIVASIRRMQKFFKDKGRTSHFFEPGVMNLTLSQLDTMAYLFERKKAKMSDLAKNLGVKMPTMTDTVDKLIKSGMVKREHDEKDRRTVWISISKDVEKMVAMHLKMRDEAVAKLLNALNDKEKRQASKILKKIVYSLERMN
ncbi:MAG TPA: MarR family transcriptional regulator [Candidatus Goldiibacteriota bacterium]|nr:MarR family transcriptional regulator [Candidatus Goldiibacteriota bacterium]